MVSVKPYLGALSSAAIQPLLSTRRSAAIYITRASVALLPLISSRPAHSYAQGFQQQQGLSHNRRNLHPADSCSSASSSSFHSSSCLESSATMATESSSIETGYLDAQSAYDLDQELMAPGKFTLEQLMELAGLSVAQAVYAVVQDKAMSSAPMKNRTKPRILLVCGPGNNGGDGLVAARHLIMFGYQCTVVFPKQSKHPHFAHLVEQCKDVGVEIVDALPDSNQLEQYDAIVDAIFGFSFKGEPREPFKSILLEMKRCRDELGMLTISVDVPSGWNVDEGDVAGTGFFPDVLISLTTPKLCSKQFEGRHFVGGRFLPPALAEKYNIRMPAYPGMSQIVEIISKEKDPNRGWEEGYAAYLAEKEAKEFAEYTKAKPSEESWEAQYAAYLAEKESKL